MINLSRYIFTIKAAYFLCVAFITISCSRIYLNDEDLKSKEVNYTDSLYITVKDTVNFLIPNSIPSELYFFNLQGGNLYGLSYANPYSIYRLSIEDEKVEEFFKLEPKHQHFKIKQYFINDSIVAVISEFGEIMEFNYKKGSYEYFRVKNDSYPSTYGFVTPFLRNPPNLYLVGNNYYFNIYPLGYFDDYSVSEKMESPLIAHFDRNNENLSFDLFPKGIMAKMGSNYYPYDLSFPYLTYIDDSFYISYPMSHQVFKYDSSFQFINQFQVSPSNPTRLPRPIEYEKLLDEKFLQEYRMETPFYSKINYHFDLNIMSRVFYSPNNIDVVKGKYEMRYGDINVIFFNGNGRIFKEFKLGRDENLLAVESSFNELVLLKRKNENKLQAIKYNIKFIDN